MSPKRLEVEVKVGLFVSLGLVLIMLSILILGSTENLMTSQNHYKSRFQNVEGLIQGSKVVLSGIQVGTIEKMEYQGQSYDGQPGSVLVAFSVAKEYSQWIKQGTIAEIQTQGMLGDKYIFLVPGSPDQPTLPNLAEIPGKQSKDISQFVSKGDQLMISLNSIATNLDDLLKNFQSGNRSEMFFQGMASTARNLSLASDKINHQLAGIHLETTQKSLNRILEKIDNGTGTVGQLINDPGLYDDVKAFMGEANQNRIVRNLVRQTIKKSEESSGQESGEAQK